MTSVPPDSGQQTEPSHALRFSRRSFLAASAIATTMFTGCQKTTRRPNVLLVMMLSAPRVFLAPQALESHFTLV